MIFSAVVCFFMTATYITHRRVDIPDDPLYPTQTTNKNGYRISVAVIVIVYQLGRSSPPTPAGSPTRWGMVAEVIAK